MKYEILTRNEWEFKRLTPLEETEIVAIVVEHSEGLTFPILSCLTVQDAINAVRGLEGRDVVSREKPQLTDTYMSQLQFQIKLLAFLKRPSGKKLRKAIEKDFGC